MIHNLLNAATPRRASILLLAVTTLLTLASTGFGTALPIGGAVLAAAGPDPTVGSTVKANSGPIGFAAAGYTGTLTSTVLTNDATNPFGLNAYTFTYLLSNSKASTHELHRLTISSFESFQTNVTYSTAFGALAPTIIDRNGGVGDVVGFGFPTPIPPFIVGPGPLLPGQTSNLLVIYTDAQNYQATQASVINGSTTMVFSFAPDRLIPEPSGVVLGGMAIVGLAASVLRRKFAK